MNRDWGLGPRAWGFVTGVRSDSAGSEAPIPRPQADGQLFVLRRISLDVAKGDFVTIMGPSGAGKSTLLAVLGMLDGDWTGEYRLLEHAVHKMKHKDRIALGKQYVGFVFQQYHLIDDLTVAENLAMPLSYRDVK